MGASGGRSRQENELTAPAVCTTVLTPDLVAFCQSGTGIALASCDIEGRPAVGRGLACRIGDGVVRIILREATNAALLRALDAGARVASTFSQPTTHRSMQLKAPAADRVAISAQDGPVAHRQVAAFCAELVAVGYDSDLVHAYTAFEPHELAAITFRPDGAFVQTPGPGAGSALT